LRRGKKQTEASYNSARHPRRERSLAANNVIFNRP
jgi:hypothetical protein